MYIQKKKSPILDQVAPDCVSLASLARQTNNNRNSSSRISAIYQVGCENNVTLSQSDNSVPTLHLSASPCQQCTCMQWSKVLPQLALKT